MTAPQPTGTATLPLSRIVKGKNPRRYFDRGKHDELVGSIRLRGIIQPIVVRPKADAVEVFEIVAGERRYRAALDVYGSNGEVPVVIREMTDEETLEAAIDENDVRDDVSASHRSPRSSARCSTPGRHTPIQHRIVQSPARAAW